MFRPSASRWVALSAMGIAATLATAESLTVQNFSFELPATTFVDPRIESWNKTPQPDWFVPQGGVAWDQLSGVFANTDPSSATHISNLDGNQAVYLFSLPQAGLTQTLDAKYEAGLQYSLTVALRGGGNITEGTSLMLGLFYLDDAGAPVSVATAGVSYSAADFSDPSRLQDRQVVSGVVGADADLVGRNIGIQIIGTSGGGEGYWDMDNVRVTAEVVPEPQTWALLALGVSGLLAFGRRNRDCR